MFCYHGVGRSLTTASSMLNLFPNLRIAYIGLQPILDNWLPKASRDKILSIISEVPVVASAIDNPGSDVTEILNFIQQTGNKPDEDIIQTKIGNIFPQLYSLIPERFPEIVSSHSKSTSVLSRQTQGQRPQTPTAISPDTQTK